MKIRIRFRRWGSMKFLGHLDMMRYFQRAVRRADIKICYSEGFSPHPVMSFAAPLGVGITSDGEYFDIAVHSTRTTAESIQALNDSMVDGIAVNGYVLLPENAKKAMAAVAAADYILYWKDGYGCPLTTAEWQQRLEEVFLSQPEFLITKKSAKTEKIVDLKKLVYRIEVIEREGRPAISLQVSTGSIDNLKPELVLSYIYEKLGLEWNPAAIQVHRCETYARTEDGFVPLLALGTEITEFIPEAVKEESEK